MGLSRTLRASSADLALGIFASARRASSRTRGESSRTSVPSSTKFASRETVSARPPAKSSSAPTNVKVCAVECKRFRNFDIIWKSKALKHHPATIETSGNQVLLANPEVEAPSVAPHHAGALFRIELQENAPVLATRDLRAQLRHVVLDRVRPT